MTTLRRLFRRPTAPSKDTDTERAAGVRNDADGAYRVQRINEFVAAMSDPTPTRVAELTDFLDQWVILRSSSGFIAFPGWEDEPLLTRDAHPTREEAVAYVESLSGSLRPGREQVIDTDPDRA